MKVVIADTSPLNYLILIDAVDVLPGLYGYIRVPAEVVQELMAVETPREVGNWIRNPPEWLQVQSPTDSEEIPALAKLDPRRTCRHSARSTETGCAAGYR